MSKKMKCYLMDEEAYMQGCPKLKEPLEIEKYTASEVTPWDKIYSKDYIAVVQHKETKKFYLVKELKSIAHSKMVRGWALPPECCQGFGGKLSLSFDYYIGQFKE